MRHLPESPHGTMDVLFTSIFFWAQDKDFDYCSLGMAPLSNVGDKQAKKTLYEASALFIYEHGERFYKFKGLKEYKAKFASDWEPRYIAYKGTSLVGVLIRIILLIHTKNETVLKLNPFHTRKAS
jgi:phosphatidylglycerol lysyltransferase